MRRSASSLAAVGLAATVMLWSPAPASAGVLSSAGGILSGVGGTILGVGKSVLCKGASAAGTVAEGATTVGGAAVGGASTEGAGTAEGAAAGSVIGGVIKKGIGGVTNLICSSSGSGAGSTLVKTAVGGVAAAATFDLAARWMIAAAQKITGAIVSTIATSASLQLTAAWFQRSFAPMAALGAALALLVTLIALTSAAARRNPAALAGTLAGIVRAGVGTGLLIALTTLALQITDGISADVIRTSHQTFWSQVGTAWGSSGFGGFGSSALAMLMAILQVIAGVIVWLELAVRNAAIYLTVLFFPDPRARVGSPHHACTRDRVRRRAPHDPHSQRAWPPPRPTPLRRLRTTPTKDASRSREPAWPHTPSGYRAFEPPVPGRGTTRHDCCPLVRPRGDRCPRNQCLAAGVGSVIRR